MEQIELSGSLPIESIDKQSNASEPNIIIGKSDKSDKMSETMFENILAQDTASHLQEGITEDTSDMLSGNMSDMLSDSMLKQGSTACPTACPIVCQNDEERSRRNEKIRKITNYKNIFGDILSDIDLRNLNYRSTEELFELAETCEFLVSTRKSIEGVHQLYISSLAIMEILSPRAGLNLSGLAATAAQSTQLKEVIDEVAVKYSDSIKIDPLHRLALVTLQLAASINSHNKALCNSTLCPPNAPPNAPSDSMSDSMSKAEDKEPKSDLTDGL